MSFTLLQLYEFYPLYWTWVDISSVYIYFLVSFIRNVWCSAMYDSKMLRCQGKFNQACWSFFPYSCCCYWRVAGRLAELGLGWRGEEGNEAECVSNRLSLLHLFWFQILIVEDIKIWWTGYCSCILVLLTLFYYYWVCHVFHWSSLTSCLNCFWCLCLRVYVCVCVCTWRKGKEGAIEELLYFQGQLPSITSGSIVGNSCKVLNLVLISCSCFEWLFKFVYLGI